MQTVAHQFTTFPLGLYLPLDDLLAQNTGGLRQADNLYYTRTGDQVRIVGRRGRVTRTTTSTKPILIHRFYPRTGSPSTLVATDSGTQILFYHDTNDDHVYQQIGPAFPTGKRWQWVNWPEKNAAFGVDGQTTLRSYDGAALAAVTLNGVQVNGPYITLWKNALWATKADELNYSVYGSEFNDATTWLSGRHLALNDPQGGPITALGGFKDALIAAKAVSLWRFQGDPRYLPASLVRYSDVGCVAPYSWSLCPWGFLFVGQAGVYLTDGYDSHPIEISQPIRSIFVDRVGQTANFKDAVGVWYPRRNQYWVKLRPADGHTYVATRVELPTAQGVVPVWLWSVYLNTPLVTAEVWESEVDDGRMLASGPTNIYEMDVGTTDSGTAYTIIATTNPVRPDPGNRPCRLQRLEAHYRGASPLTVNLRVDTNPANLFTFTLGGSLSSPDWQRTHTTNTNYSAWGPYAWFQLESPDHREFELHNLVASFRVAAKRYF